MLPGPADAEVGGQEHTSSSAWLAAPVSADANGHSELPPSPVLKTSQAVGLSVGIAPYLPPSPPETPQLESFSLRR